jgi:cytochrome c oxidase subunit 2
MMSGSRSSVAVWLTSTVLGSVLAVGCHGAQNVLAPAGPGARNLAFLGRFALIIFSITTLATWALLLAAALRRRGSLQHHEPIDVGGGQGWILIGGLIIPALTFAVLFVLTLLKMDEFPLHDPALEHAPEIRVIGHQWWWEVEYLGDTPNARIKTANELHIPIGQPVELELTSSDVVHSFWVPKLHGKVDLIPGWKNHLRIQADELGSYEGQCAEFCGVQHAQMRLLVVAQAAADYAAWVAAEQRPAPPPGDEHASRGQMLFETRACGLCHTVRGTRALGSVGPDLTHLAGRQLLAANSLPNNHAFRSAWTLQAQSWKPGVSMPNLSDFTGPDLDALEHFLDGLH